MPWSKHGHLPDASLTCWARKDWLKLRREGWGVGVCHLLSTSPPLLWGPPSPPGPAVTATTPVLAFPTSLRMAALAPLPLRSSRTICLSAHCCSRAPPHGSNHSFVCLAGSLCNVCLSLLQSARFCLLLHPCLTVLMEPPSQEVPSYSQILPSARGTVSQLSRSFVLTYLTYTNMSHFKLNFYSSVDFTCLSFIPSNGNDKLAEVGVNFLHAPWYWICDRCSVRHWIISQIHLHISV